MRAALIVFVKEFRENLRDRRTVLAALVLGPLFGPLLFGGLLKFTLEREDRDAATPLVVAVVNAEAAPNLMAALRARRVTTEELAGGEEAASAAVRSGRAKLVLVVDPDYAMRLAAAEPASLRLYVDASRSGDQQQAARLARVIAEQSQRIASQRLVLRGVDPTALVPIVVDQVDVSTPTGRAVLVLGSFSFFLILAMMTGGLYLAIDTIAGERERGTLEPLLTTPVARGALLHGKLLATSSYMLLSLVLTAASFFIVLGRIDLSSLGMSANLGAPVALRTILAATPLIPAAAALMTLVASFARSTREAQAWLSLVQLVPTLPLVFAGMMNLQPTALTMLVPSLSQHFLITRLLRAEPVTALEYASSAGGSLLLGAVLLALAHRVYRRDALLG
jgi:sodium transport system permease protein